jgi:hypothetical protein
MTIPLGEVDIDHAWVRRSRVARILKSPVVGLLCNNVWSFNSQSQVTNYPDDTLNPEPRWHTKP